MKIGRIRRKTYLILTIVIVGFNFIISQNLDFRKDEDLSILIVILIGSLIITSIINGGRLNDINLSGWYALLYFVPIVNLGILALYFIDGTKGDNLYGPDPKGRIDVRKSLEKQVNHSRNNTYQNNQISKFNIDEKITLIQESYNEGLLTKAEFLDKENELLKEKKRQIEQIKNNKTLKEKTDKLNKLLENHIITKSNYDNKFNALQLEYRVKDIKSNELNLDTHFFYIQRGKELGPFSGRKIISLLNNDQINPKCLVRVDQEKFYSRRAHELIELLK